MLKTTQTATQGAAVACVSVHINEALSCFCVLHSLFHGSLFPRRDNLTWIFFFQAHIIVPLQRIRIEIHYEEL